MWRFYREISPNGAALASIDAFRQLTAWSAYIFRLGKRKIRLSGPYRRTVFWLDAHQIIRTKTAILYGGSLGAMLVGLFMGCIALVRAYDATAASYRCDLTRIVDAREKHYTALERDSCRDLLGMAQRDLAVCRAGGTSLGKSGYKGSRPW